MEINRGGYIHNGNGWKSYVVNEDGPRICYKFCNGRTVCCPASPSHLHPHPPIGASFFFVGVGFGVLFCLTLCFLARISAGAALTNTTPASTLIASLVSTPTFSTKASSPVSLKGGWIGHKGSMDLSLLYNVILYLIVNSVLFMRVCTVIRLDVPPLVRSIPAVTNP